MLLVYIIIFLSLYSTIFAANTNYQTSCVCTQAAVNGSLCWAWTCTTRQDASCFSSDATVEIMRLKQRKLMKNLQIGDEILVEIDDQGQRIYEPVYGFIHASSQGIYEYLKITVENQFEQSLIISSNHLIYRFNQSQPIFAGHLIIGDQLQMISKDGYKQAGSIRDIQLIKSEGFYAPLTSSGKLVVDGIIVSNYATVANDQLAHLAMQPYRWWVHFNGPLSYAANIHWYCQYLYTLVKQINKWLFSIRLYDGNFIVSSF